MRAGCSVSSAKESYKQHPRQVGDAVGALPALQTACALAVPRGGRDALIKHG